MADKSDKSDRFQAKFDITRKDWLAFGTVAGDRDRSRLLREFARWYAGVPGARAPRRPLDDCPP